MLSVSLLCSECLCHSSRKERAVSLRVPLSAAVIRQTRSPHSTFFIGGWEVEGGNPHLRRSRSCFFKVTMATVSKVIYYSTWSLSGWYARLLATIAPRPPVISSAHTSSSSSISFSSSSPVVMNMIYSCLLSSRCSSCSTVCDRLSTSVITLMRGELVSKPQERSRLA